MAEASRYSVNGQETNILENKLGIHNTKLLEDTETLLLSDSYNYFLELHAKNKIQFNTKLLFKIHKYFLDPLYHWAGKIRTVEISKAGILFCASLQIENELKKLNRNIQATIAANENNFSKELAVLHCEYNAIHPFRDGNGRTIRLFLDLLAIKKGYNFINYSKVTHITYIEACIAGMQKDYSKMEEIFNLSLTIRK